MSNLAQRLMMSVVLTLAILLISVLDQFILGGFLLGIWHEYMFGVRR